MESNNGLPVHSIELIRLRNKLEGVHYLEEGVEVAKGWKVGTIGTRKGVITNDEDAIYFVSRTSSAREGEECNSAMDVVVVTMLDDLSGIVRSTTLSPNTGTGTDQLGPEKTREVLERLSSDLQRARRKRV